MKDPTALITRRQQAITKTDADLRALAEQLEDAEQTWQQVEYSFQPTVICSECGGRGQTSNGTFGDVECWICNGGRVVPDPRPNAKQLLAPDFGRARKYIGEARQALISHERWLTAAERAVYDGKALPDDPEKPMPGTSELSAIRHEIGAAQRKIDAVIKPPTSPADRLHGEPHLELDTGSLDADVVDGDD